MVGIPSEKFEEILKLVWYHLVAANAHLTIWEELRSTPERERLSNTYPGFFRWTGDAHVNGFIHKVCIVTDRDRSQPSIYKLTSMMQTHPSLAPTVDCRRVLERLETHRMAQEALRAVRDKRLSHYDLTKSVEPEPDVSGCRALLTELGTLMEEIWNAYQPNQSGGHNFYPLIAEGSHDTSYVLDELASQLPLSKS